MNELLKLSEQQRNQGAINLKIKILQQNHDEQLAETFKPPKKIIDKLNNTEDKDNQSPTTIHELVHVEDILEKSADEAENNVSNIGALSNSSNLSKLMKET